MSGHDERTQDRPRNKAIYPIREYSTHIYIYIFINTCIYIYIYIYMYIYICIYIYKTAYGCI